MIVRHSTEEDMVAVLDIHRKAFEQEEEAALVDSLMRDPTAQPLISLVAQDTTTLAGHVLLTTASVRSATGESGRDVMLLAPLAVVPEMQGRGVGGSLVREALQQARQQGVIRVFVLGHPGYYPRFGFRPAGERGFSAPYPIPDEYADAWMVVEIVASGGGSPSNGVVHPADALKRPELWRE